MFFSLTLRYTPLFFGAPGHRRNDGVAPSSGQKCRVVVISDSPDVNIRFHLLTWRFFRGASTNSQWMVAATACTSSTDRSGVPNRCGSVSASELPGSELPGSDGQYSDPSGDVGESPLGDTGGDNVWRYMVMWKYLLENVRWESVQTWSLIYFFKQRKTQQPIRVVPILPNLVYIYLIVPNC